MYNRNVYNNSCVFLFKKSIYIVKINKLTNLYNVRLTNIEIKMKNFDCRKK